MTKKRQSDPWQQIQRAFPGITVVEVIEAIKVKSMIMQSRAVRKGQSQIKFVIKDRR